MLLCMHGMDMQCTDAQIQSNGHIQSPIVVEKVVVLC